MTQPRPIESTGLIPDGENRKAELFDLLHVPHQPVDDRAARATRPRRGGEQLAPWSVADRFLVPTTATSPGSRLSTASISTAYGSGGV